MSQFVAPTGYVDLDNDCEFSIDRKSTRSRESINPKEDLAFYFDTYIVPKYGLNNINVNNVASFMKDLDMNWSKLTPDLKDKVMNIMVDGILIKDTSFDFKASLLHKLQIPTNIAPINSSFTNTFSKSSFGSFNSNKKYMMIGGGIVLIILIYIYLKKNKKTVSFGRLS